MLDHTGSAAKFSLGQARGIVHDLFTPKLVVYWTDLLLSSMLGGLCFVLTRRVFEPFSLPSILAFIVCGLCYCLSVFILMLNAIRTLGAHRYTNTGGEMTFLDQLLDSVNYPNHRLLSALWAPLGLRFHALHHVFPSMPYHNLDEAHRRLMAELPADSPYRQTVSPSLTASIVQLWRTSRAAAKAVRRAQQRQRVRTRSLGGAGQELTGALAPTSCWSYFAACIAVRMLCNSSANASCSRIDVRTTIKLPNGRITLPRGVPGASGTAGTDGYGSGARCVARRRRPRGGDSTRQLN